MGPLWGPPPRGSTSGAKPAAHLASELQAPGFGSASAGLWFGFGFGSRLASLKLSAGFWLGFLMDFGWLSFTMILVGFGLIWT